jgi:hypothetical protein
MPVMQNFELRRVVDFPGQFKLIFKLWKKRVATFHLAFDERKVEKGSPRRSAESPLLRRGFKIRCFCFSRGYLLFACARRFT